MFESFTSLLEYLFTTEQRSEIFIYFFYKTFFDKISYFNRKDLSSNPEKKFETEINVFKELFLKSELKEYQTILK